MGDLKLSYTNKSRRMRVETTNPNDSIRAWYLDQFREAFEQGYRELLTEVEYAIRKVKKGQTIVVRGYPLVVEVCRTSSTKAERRR